MKTVVDFKKAGLVFVSGDKVHEKTGCGTSKGEDLMSCTIKHMCDDDFISIGENYAHKDWTIHSLAWRTNTGEKPSFSGLIEFTYNGEGCEMQECRHPDNINWSIVKKWRPSLNQQSIQTETPEEKEVFDSMKETKPAFTQATMDDGELPPVGSEFEMYMYLANANKWVKCYAVGYTKDLKHLVIHDDEDGLHFVSKERCCMSFRPIDNRTPKQKVVDEMFEDAEVRGSKGAFERLYDAGYRKIKDA